MIWLIFFIIIWYSTSLFFIIPYVITETRKEEDCNGNYFKKTSIFKIIEEGKETFPIFTLKQIGLILLVATILPLAIIWVIIDEFLL